MASLRGHCRSAGHQTAGQGPSSTHPVAQTHTRHSGSSGAGCAGAVVTRGHDRPRTLRCIYGGPAGQQVCLTHHCCCQLSSAQFISSASRPACITRSINSGPAATASPCTGPHSYSRRQLPWVAAALTAAPCWSQQTAGRHTYVQDTAVLTKGASLQKHHACWLHVRAMARRLKPVRPFSQCMDAASTCVLG